MKFRSIPFVFVLQFIFTFVFAQKQSPNNWFNLDPKKDKIYGVGTERTYRDIIKERKGKTVIVAVIDGGTDSEHEDLKEIIWTNRNEIAGNGKDDDNNGYIDDIHGWNFIGGKNGENVNQDNLEVTRVYAKLKPRYEKADTNELSVTDKAEYYKYIFARKEYFKGKQEGNMYYNLYNNIVKGMESIAKNIGKSKLSFSDVNDYKPQDQNEMMAQTVMKQTFGKKPSVNDTVPFNGIIEGISEAQKHFEKQVKYNYNTDLDTRKIVGDNYDDITERSYGNNDIKGPSADHGTHVAGIIAAVRNNNKGMDGIAQNVQIMVVRVVPDGDERDKDVANGIRYAVDNGATVINMSFGKAFSYNKKTVDDAVKYAQKKDVLIVHAAGNDASNNDVVSNFPSPFFENSTERADNWIEVGASSWLKNKELAANFSNYGINTVDVFAPGVSIYSTLPDSKYGRFDGTSMAAPVTSGVAAMIRSYYPELSAVQVKDIITKSVTTVKKKVMIPGEKNKKARLKDLSKTGGVVNMYEAFVLAEHYKK